MPWSKLQISFSSQKLTSSLKIAQGISPLLLVCPMPIGMTTTIYFNICCACHMWKISSSVLDIVILQNV